MSETKDGGPAFPTGSGAAQFGREGMSLRDWFAATAPCQIEDGADALWWSMRTGVPRPESQSDVIAWCRFWIQAEAVSRYQYADAMLAAREPKEDAQ